MQPIDPIAVQEALNRFKDRQVYLSLEMTTGAYASLMDSNSFTASTFIKNGGVNFTIGTITGEGPYRVGLKTADGWVYSQGLTHWDKANDAQLILAGHDDAGRLIVGLILSNEPI